ncbi:hypothetical protein GF380_02930 [Candidatus Uhrbacteria bacterium]|nr:hypothetical protein [Candidatus Uhrbacteria bacterium]MBD3284103.1 hypothetical protein [Candidatus Uhrbacteria bacterium]
MKLKALNEQESKPPTEAKSESKVSEKAGKKKDEVTESLAAIYEGQPSKEWLNTMDHGKRKTWMTALVSVSILLLVIIGAAWLGFWIWGGRGFSGDGIRIQIEGPDRIAVGQEITYFVNWFNVSREPLASTEFRISFPNDFIISDIDPEPTSQPLVFRLGAQSVEARGTIKVTGRFTGALDTTSHIQVIGTYRPASFNSDFEELMTKQIVYADSVFKGELEILPKVLPGDEVTIRYRIENTGSERMEGLRARFPIPEGFVLNATGTEGEIADFEVLQDLEPLEAGASTELTFVGAFSLGSSGDVEVVGEVGYTTPDGRFAAAQRSTQNVSVLAGDLSINVVINGSQDDRSVNLGEWQRIAVAYENTSGELLEDVTLVLHLEPMEGDEILDLELVDWEQLEDELKGSRSGNSVTFTAKQLEDLETIEANADGTIELSVPIVNSITSDEDVPIHAYVEATIVNVGGQEVNRIVKTKPMLLTLQTDAQIQSVARYSSVEGAPLGSGPLPPQVGSSTTYRVEWTVTKSLHELERLSVSASLPKATRWGTVKEIDAGEAGYDPDSKLVTWKINKMPEDVDELLLSFDVVLSPSEADVGRFAKLLSETRFEFTDAKLQESLVRTSGALNTDLPDDSIAQRKGVVAKD